MSFRGADDPIEFLRGRAAGHAIGEDEVLGCRAAGELAGWLVRPLHEIARTLDLVAEVVHVGGPFEGHAGGRVRHFHGDHFDRIKALQCGRPFRGIAERRKVDAATGRVAISTTQRLFLRCDHVVLDPEHFGFDDTHGAGVGASDSGLTCGEGGVPVIGFPIGGSIGGAGGKQVRHSQFAGSCIVGLFAGEVLDREQACFCVADAASQLVDGQPLARSDWRIESGIGDAADRESWSGSSSRGNRDDWLACRRWNGTGHR